MDKIKGNFGFGCMRLPMIGDEVDIEQTIIMTDAFMAAGFNYFDTAHGYIDGKSETALKACLTSRYPRESYFLTNKLSGYFDKEEDIIPLFQSQLEACGVDYFDLYLMHAQGQGNYGKYMECRAYEISLELLKEGKIRHFGISYHDNAEFLDKLLTEWEQIEAVQLQFNYIDFEDDDVQARKCYEVCRKHGKKVIVMEPVKGGCLADLPENAKRVFDALEGGSAASYAIRFAAGFEGVMMTLSGMGSMEMMNDNLSFMTDFKPLDEKEKAAVDTVVGILRKGNDIPCTGCRYCVEKCPQGIVIPEIFTCLNKKNRAKHFSYERTLEKSGSAKASECIRCGACEAACPQHLKIRELLEECAKCLEF